MKGRAESYGHKKKSGEESKTPVIGVDYTHTHSEQDKEEERGMPIVVIKDSRSRMVFARVVPSKGVTTTRRLFTTRLLERCSTESW